MNLPFELVDRLIRFCVRTRQTLTGPLGGGKDGDVFTTARMNAVKFLSDSNRYRRERDVYLRFKEMKVTRVLGFNLPKLISFHDDLNAVEMSIVRPPFVLDFAGAHLDWPPDFPPEVIAENEDRIRDLFDTDNRYEQVFALLHELRERYDVYMLDVWPGNIQF
jgi:hypothetical protein